MKPSAIMYTTASHALGNPCPVSLPFTTLCYTLFCLLLQTKILQNPNHKKIYIHN